MKRMVTFIVAVALVLSFSLTAFADTTQKTTETETTTVAETTTAAESKDKNYDFKTFCWGDSEEDVISVEGEPYTEDKMDAVDANYIVYETTVAGIDALLAYYFCDEGLYEARYILTEEHSNESLYIDDYEKIRDAITKKYGDPLLDYEDWYNDSKKSYYADDKGKALCYGYLSYYTWYLNDRSEINMTMSADNYEISTIIYFTSNDIEPGEADYSDDF